MKSGMDWNPSAYGPEVESLLAPAGDGRRLMPLISPRNAAHAIQPALSAATLAGLYLYLGCFDQAHSIAQDIHSPDGAYWHAILHRMEPDPANAAYWFRRVGQHPIFADVRAAAAALGLPNWDPFSFIDACREPARESLLQQVQLAEWQLLFHHCAKIK